VLAGRADWLDAAEPYLPGRRAVREVTVDDVQWWTGPRRHEAGTPNLAGAVALATALDVLADHDLEGHERALRTRLVSGLSELDGVRVLSIWDDAPDAIGVVAFALDDHVPGLVGTYLSNEHGLGVRAGRFCAHPLLARFALPDGALRASFGVGSRLDDVDRLVGAVAEFLRSGPRFDYELDAEGWGPRLDTRDVGGWPGLDPSA